MSLGLCPLHQKPLIYVNSILWMTLTFSNLALLHFCHSSIEFEGHLNRIVKPSINGAVESLKCISDQPLTFQHKGGVFNRIDTRPWRKQRGFASRLENYVQMKKMKLNIEWGVQWNDPWPWGSRWSVYPSRTRALNSDHPPVCAR